MEFVTLLACLSYSKDSNVCELVVCLLYVLECPLLHWIMTEIATASVK